MFIAALFVMAKYCKNLHEHEEEGGLWFHHTIELRTSALMNEPGLPGAIGIHLKT